MTLKYIKNDYIQQFKDADCKYIVLKVEDLVNCLDDWDEWDLFQNLLDRYNERRAEQGKGINKYFVANRDDFPELTSAEEFIDALHNFINMVH
jgi:hypothetical protein